MVGFSNVLGGIGHWFEHLISTATAKQIIAVGEDVGKKVIVNAAMAGLAAHATGASKDDTLKAIEHSATTTLATVGVAATTDEVKALVGHISDSLHAAPETAPAPPTG